MFMKRVMGLSVVFIIPYYVIIGTSYTAIVPVKPPDVKIDVNLSALTVNVSWKLPTDMEVKITVITLYDSKGRKLYEDDVFLSSSNYLIQKEIHQCMQYTVGLIFNFGQDRWLDRSYFKFDTFGIPSTPHLSVNPSHYFVGNSLTFTCRSSVRRRPVDNQSCLSYTYVGINGTSVGEDLVVSGLQKSHMGIEVGCIVNDNYHNMSEYSNMIILNPNYGPDEIEIKPNYIRVEISEGETLGPYECTAGCNPPCHIRWRTNIGGGANITFHTSTLRIPDIARNQKGIYTCDVSHQHDSSRYKYISITVNVLDIPKPCNNLTANTVTKSNVDSTVQIAVTGTLSAVIVLLLLVIVFISITFHLEKKKNQQQFQQQRSIVQRNSDGEDVHYMTADLQASASARSQVESHAYDIMRREIPENGDRMYVEVE